MDQGRRGLGESRLPMTVEGRILGECLFPIFSDNFEQLFCIIMNQDHNLKIGRTEESLQHESGTVKPAWEGAAEEVAPPLQFCCRLPDPGGGEIDMNLKNKTTPWSWLFFSSSTRHFAKSPPISLNMMRAAFAAS